MNIDEGEVYELTCKYLHRVGTHTAVHMFFPYSFLLLHFELCGQSPMHIKLDLVI